MDDSQQVRELWEYVYRSFHCHRIDAEGDKNAQDALTRIASKCLGLSTRPSIAPSNCRIRKEHLSGEDLHELVLYHDRRKPWHPKDPIIVMVWEGRRYVIDGNNRVRVWRQIKAKNFEAVVLEPYSA